MQRVTRSTAAALLPAAPASPGTPGYFTGGDPVGNVPATVPGYEWFNGVQEELIGVILRSGLAPDQADLAQLRKSLDRLFGGGLRTVSANTTLTPDDAGLVLVETSAGSRTITLPAASAAGGRPIRFEFVRTDVSAFVATVQRAGADLIEGQTTITIPVGGRVVLVSDGVSAWRVLGGVAGRNMQVFTSGGTFVVPAAITRIKCRVWGGGGGGGGVGSGGGGAAGGCGGGYAEGWYDVTPGASLTVTIGAGGIGGTGAPTSGGNGGTTSIGALLSATGGLGGSAADGGGAAVGNNGVGTGTGGQLNLSGNPTNPGLSVGGTLLGSSGGGTFGASLVGGYSASSGNGSAVPGGGGGGAGGPIFAAGGAGAAGLAIIEW